MRKFRFIGNPDEYDILFIKFGEVYNENDIPWTEDGKPNKDWTIDKNVLGAFKEYPEDWEEVFDEPIKQLHKDTDLGYFAGVALNGLLSDQKRSGSSKDFAETAILFAKELINQLDEKNKAL